MVVGVGASAGGLEAFSGLLSGLPPDTGMAFVLVQHLEPTHASNLAQILGRMTPMPVTQVTDGMRVEPNHVYVIPPDTVMRIKDGALGLRPRPKVHAPSLTVDIFMRSLAEESGDRAIGVVLSGAASDGVQGLTAIAAANGITIVQDPETARYSGMPGSAVAAGVADKVLPVAEIGPELARLARHPYILPAAETGEGAEEGRSDDALERILERLRSTSGLDLRHYKRATLRRRIERRMAVRHADSHADYLRILERDAGETAALFGEVLVRVTSFFRDPVAFKALAGTAFPRIFRNKRGDAPVRVWVAGCATGQEAYSVAISLFEYMESSGTSRPLQIFASDLREGDLEFARRGIYPATITSEVSPERLERFFSRVESGYRINKSIREACVFARHDVTSDPPFARLDLLTCRNLLIYMDTVLQRRVVTLFHYALVEGGTLFLGKSEGTGAAADLFDRTEGKGIFLRLRVPTPAPAFGAGPGGTSRPVAEAAYRAEVTKGPDPVSGEWPRRLDELLLDRYAPAALLVDSDLSVLQLRGDAGAFLRPRPGPASLDLTSMASEGLAAAVRSAVDEASDSRLPARRPGLRVLMDGRHRVVDVVVIPMPVAESGPAFAVLLGDASDSGPGGAAADACDPSEVEYLRQELVATTDRLRLQTFRREGANEELQAAYEEIQSSNEELQSINEELETAKEELESTNEELTTLNDELQSRNRELRDRNDDLNNLVASVHIPIVMLDGNLAIRRYTAPAAEIFSVIPGDVGRPITDIRSKLDVPEFETITREVLASGEADEREVRTQDGRWFRMSVQPYRREEGRTDGAVVSLLDVDEMHRYQETLQETVDLGQVLNRMSAAFDAAGSLREAEVIALTIAAEGLGAERGELFLLADGVWRLEGRSSGAGDTVLPEPFTTEESEALGLGEFADRTVVVEPDALHAGAASAVRGTALAGSRLTVPIVAPGGELQGVVRFGYGSAHERFTDPQVDFCARLGIVMALTLERARREELARRLAEELTADLRATGDKLGQAAHVKDAFLANMSHELRTPLNSIIGFSTVLLDGLAGELNPEQHRQLEMVLNSGNHLLAIISDILDLEKIEAGAMPVTATEFTVSDVTSQVVSLLRPLAIEKGIELVETVDASCGNAVGDALKVRQVLLNLVSNAVKFTHEGTVTVTAECTDDDLVFVVEDTGRGMTAEDLERAFVEFQQIGQEGLAKATGTGLGLSIARRLCRLLGGDLTAESTPGVGSTFRATVKRDLRA